VGWKKEIALGSSSKNHGKTSDLAEKRKSMHMGSGGNVMGEGKGSS